MCGDGQHIEQRNETATFCETFTQNGGVNRDFNKGELDLTPIESYEIAADATVTVTERLTVFGEVFGAESESEAYEAIMSNAPVWMTEYGDTIDSDYGTLRDVVNLEIHKVNEQTISPTMVGLK